MLLAVFLHALLLLTPSTAAAAAAAWLITTANRARLSHAPPSGGRADHAAASWPRRTTNPRRAAVVVEHSSQLSSSDVHKHHRVVQEEEEEVPERLPTSGAVISVVEELQHRLYAQQNSSVGTTTRRRRLVQVEGYVTAKRAFGSSFCFLDLIPVVQAQQQQQQAQEQPVQAMLKRQEFDGNNNNNNKNSDLFYFDGYMKSIVPGIRIEIVGHVVPTRNAGEALLLIRQMRITAIPRNPQHVRILLQSVADHQLPALEMVQAIQASLTTGVSVMTATGGAWFITAAQLVETLQQEKQQLNNSTTSSRIEKQPFYRLAKEIVSHLRPLQQQGHSDNGKNDTEQDVKTDFVTSLEQSLKSGTMKHASSLLLPVAGCDIRQPPKEASMYNVNSNSNKRDQPSNIFTLNQETTTRGVDSVQTLQEQFLLVKDQGQQGMASVTVRAWVQNRRRFQNDITILEVMDTMDASYPAGTSRPIITSNDGDVVDFWNGRLKCVLHPDVFMSSLQAMERKNQKTIEIAHVYSQLLAPGSLALWHGYVSPSSSSSSSRLRPPIFWVTNVRLLRASWRPSVICYFLELFVEHQQKKNHANFLDADEVVQALDISNHELNDIVNSDLTQRQWAAAEISKSLQQGLAAARMGTIDPQHMAILESFQDLRRRHPVTAVHASYNYNNNKSSALDERTGSRWRRKKEPQLEWMTEQVRHVVVSHPDYGTRPLRILDVGGGKGLLANRLAAALGGNTSSSVEIHVIDVAQGAIKNGAMRSKRLALPVKYSVQDASTARINGDIDVVVALHACGTLSDVALEQAVGHEAGFVICPCCFRSNPHLQIPSRSPNGQPMSVQKWLGIADDDAPFDDWNALTSLAEVQGDIELSQRALHTICALRAAAFHRHSAETNKTRPNVHADIRTFPLAFSTRNFCLVGTFS
jgi:Methyltransferase domain